jgi:hypothetical protein
MPRVAVTGIGMQPPGQFALRPARVHSMALAPLNPAALPDPTGCRALDRGTRDQMAHVLKEMQATSC